MLLKSRYKYFFIFFFFRFISTTIIIPSKPYYGCVLYRISPTHDRVEYLLVQSSYGHYRWGLLKGFLQHFSKQSPENFVLFRLQKIFKTRDNIFKILPDFTTTIEFNVANNTKHGTFYLAELTAPMPNIRDILPLLKYKDYRWLPYKEAHRILFFPDLQNLIKTCHEFLKTKGIASPNESEEELL